MRRFLLYAHTGREAALTALTAIVTEMRHHDVRGVLIDEQVDEILSGDLADADLRSLLTGGAVDVLDSVSAADAVELAIVLGGDGTILRALEVVREADVPVHGVNLGHVGFLAESEVADLAFTVRRLLAGEYVIEPRSALDVRVFDADDRLLATHWALNEASLEKADRQKMLLVVIEIDGRPVSSFGCDGVLLSTSTGSTAYAFSAGGPVVWPEVDALVVVPLAAHALFARPLVLGRSSQAAVEISPENRDLGVLTLDGRRVEEIRPGMRLEATLSEQSVRLVRLHRTPFADRLVEKFELPVEGWRGRGPGAA
ncbi:NAD kinase [Brachybacterium sp. EF45031]|uniref:NAD kinase n=1 Tax=Brachybacterium sillae TaxID=2810536 RepID=UPI00217DB05D|nr:NAD kinase [Brachybacterium sillae]MCS6712677.1 NAD kinase [Brachybacterium sillae]